MSANIAEQSKLFLLRTMTRSSGFSAGRTCCAITKKKKLETRINEISAQINALKAQKTAKYCRIQKFYPVTFRELRIEQRFSSRSSYPHCCAV